MEETESCPYQATVVYLLRLPREVGDLIGELMLHEWLATSCLRSAMVRRFNANSCHACSR